MATTVRVAGDVAGAAKIGRAIPTSLTLTLTDADLASWTQEVRDLYADLLSDTRDGLVVYRPSIESTGYYSSPIAVVAATADGLRDSLQAALDARAACAARVAQNKAEQLARYAEADAKLAAGPVDGLLQCPYPGETAPWRIHTPSPESAHPLTMARINAEAIPERDRRNAAIAAERAAAKAEAARKAAAELESLRAWALEHGSELTRARLAEGYDCWVSSANSDRAIIASEYADQIANSIPVGEIDEPSDYDDTSDEPRKCPTLAEIEAVRTARDHAPPGTKVELVRRTYTQTIVDEDEDGDETDRTTKHYRTVLVLTIPHEFGAQVREWCIKS